MLDFMVSGQNGCEGAELLYIHITLWLLWGHTLLHLAAEKL